MGNKNKNLRERLPEPVLVNASNGSPWMKPGYVFLKPLVGGCGKNTHRSKRTELGFEAYMVLTASLLAFTGIFGSPSSQITLEAPLANLARANSLRIRENLEGRKKKNYLT